MRCIFFRGSKEPRNLRFRGWGGRALERIIVTSPSEEDEQELSDDDEERREMNREGEGGLSLPLHCISLSVAYLEGGCPTLCVEADGVGRG